MHESAPETEKHGVGDNQLREIVGKSELHEALGGNRREAERLTHAVLARLHGIFDEARLKLGTEAPPRLSRRLDTPGLARHHFQSESDLDAALRDAGAFAASGFDPAICDRLFTPAYLAALHETLEKTASRAVRRT